MNVAEISFLWITPQGVTLSSLQTIVQPRRLNSLRITGLPEKWNRALTTKLDVVLYELMGAVSGRIHVHFASFKDAAHPAECELPVLISILAAHNNCALKNVASFGEIDLNGTIRIAPAAVRLLQQDLRRNPTRLKDKIVISPIELGLDQEIKLGRLNREIYNEKLLPLLRYASTLKTVNNAPTRKEIYMGEEWYHSLSRTQKQCATLILAGWHSLLLVGPPGVGKSYFAQGCGGMLSDASILAGRSAPTTIQPNSQASPEQLVFGYRTRNMPSCWEESRGGLLWLDEMTEFRRSSLEALRTPLDGAGLRHPRLFIGTSNPCPCGYWNHDNTICHCEPKARAQYGKKISGPLLDRIAMGFSPLDVDLRSAVPLKETYAEQLNLIAHVWKQSPKVGMQWMPSTELEKRNTDFGNKIWAQVSRRRKYHILRRMRTLEVLCPELKPDQLLTEALLWDGQNFIHRWWQNGPVLSVSKKEEKMDENSLDLAVKTRSLEELGLKP